MMQSTRGFNSTLSFPNSMRLGNNNNKMKPRVYIVGLFDLLSLMAPFKVFIRFSQHFYSCQNKIKHRSVHQAKKRVFLFTIICTTSVVQIIVNKNTVFFAWCNRYSFNKFNKIKYASDAAFLITTVIFSLFLITRAIFSSFYLPHLHFFKILLILLSMLNKFPLCFEKFIRVHCSMEGSGILESG